MINFKRSGSAVAVAAILLVSPFVLAQDMIPVELPDQVNLVGLGVFAVPDYHGSAENDAAVAPLLRHSWDGTSYV
jgi:outer membrane protein